MVEMGRPFSSYQYSEDVPNTAIADAAPTAPDSPGDDGQYYPDVDAGLLYFRANGVWYSTPATFTALASPPRQVSQWGVPGSHWGNICWGI